MSKSAPQQPFFTTRLIALIILVGALSASISYFIMRPVTPPDPTKTNPNVIPLKEIPKEDWKPEALSPEHLYIEKHVHTYISKNQKPIRDCYFGYRGKAKLPADGGRITAQFYIEKDGSPTRIKAFRSNMDIPDIQVCVLNQIGTWQFPPHDLAQAVRVQYPFFFR
jgi:hypothetical protein